MQETVLSVSKSMPGFRYDSEKGSFKNWLMRLTSWRIADQFRKRERGVERGHGAAELSTDTPTIERVADPVGSNLEALWEKEWEANLMEAALDRIKRKVDPKHYQIFDLYVLKQWPVSKVARTLKVNRGRIYLIKHRIKHLIKREVLRLRTKPI